MSDAPFIGSILIAPHCYRNCKDCHNQHLKDDKVQEEKIEEILRRILDNPFDEGIILAGLEWTYSPEDMKCIIEESLREKLKVMLYTYMNEDKFKNEFPSIYKKKIWVKFGKFDLTKEDDNYYSYGVKLSTKNQYIKKLGVV